MERTGREDSDMQAPQKQLRPNVKRLNSVTKEASKTNPVKEKLKSVLHEKKEPDKAKDENTSIEEKDAPKGLVTLKDLCAEDKQRVANLIKELARVDEEKESALSQLAQQKVSYEDQTRILATEREKMRLEREGVEAQLRECQKLLEKYQKTLKEQQEKKIIENLAERVRTKKTFLGGNTNPVPEVKRPLLHQLPTDVKYNDFAGTDGERLRGAGNQIVVVSSTLPHLAKNERGTSVVSQANPAATMICSRSGEDPVEYKLTSNASDPIISFTDPRKSLMTCPLSQPDLSSTRYSDEEFLPGRCSEPRTGVPSVFSGTRRNQLSAENLGGSVRPPDWTDQRSWNANRNSNHSNNAVENSRYSALGGQKQFGQFEITEAEGNWKILSAESLDDETERLREVLQSQREFLKKQEQELRLLFDAQHLSSAGLGLGTCSYNGRAASVDQRPDISALRPKPLLTAADTVKDSALTEHAPRSISVGTSPLKFETSKKTSSETEVSTNRINDPSIPSNVIHRMESQKQPPLLNETKGDARFPRKKHQTGKSTVRFDDRSTSHRSTGRHRNSRERRIDENDSDSSLEESKIIDELFFVK